MECVVITIVILVMLVLGWIGIGYGFSGGSSQRTLRAIAARFRGRLHGGWFSSQSVEFRSEGLVTCEFISYQGRWWLEVRMIPLVAPAVGRIVSLPNKRAQIPVIQGFSYFTRFRDGDGHEHVLYHQDAQDGYQLLSDGVRQQVGLLRQIPFAAALEIYLHNETLVVRKVWNSIVPENGVRFVQQTLNFRDQLQLLSSGAITFVPDSAPVKIEAATCKVCGEMIEAKEIVLCSRCRTPHHQDCWAYGEGCSVYGCGGKEAVPFQAR